VDLQLVEHAGLERGLRHRGAVNEDIAIAGGGLGFRHGAHDSVVDVRHERILRGGLVRRSMTHHKNRNGEVMVTASVVDLLHGLASRQHRAGCLHFVERELAES
jgi:hypothetical protein